MAQERKTYPEESHNDSLTVLGALVWSKHLSGRAFSGHFCNDPDNKQDKEIAECWGQRADTTNEGSEEITIHFRWSIFLVQVFWELDIITTPKELMHKVDFLSKDPLCSNSQHNPESNHLTKSQSSSLLSPLQASNTRVLRSIPLYLLKNIKIKATQRVWL